MLLSDGVCFVPQAGLDHMSKGHMLADVVAIIGKYNFFFFHFSLSLIILHFFSSVCFVDLHVHSNELHICLQHYI